MFLQGMTARIEPATYLPVENTLYPADDAKILEDNTTIAARRTRLLWN